MKKCKYCQSEIDIQAKICPNCRKKQAKPTWLIILIIIVAIVIVSAITDGGDDTNSTDGNTSTKKTQAKKFSYTISNSYSDKFGYYIEGTVKNNKDKDYSYVQIEFVCYDADGNNLGTAIDNTNNLLGNETWKFKAMGLFTDGRTVDHCDYHEVTSW